MAAIIQVIHRIEHQFDSRTKQFAEHHACLAFLVMFLVLPVCMLLLIVACTMLFMLPLVFA